MSDSILLHPTKGVNPRLMVCLHCGKDTGVVLLGIHDKKWTCKSCGLRHIQNGRPAKCQSCGSRELKCEQLGEFEKIGGDLCDECMAKEKECAGVVRLGGIRWKCKDCGSAGAIRAESELSKAVRKQMGIEPPNPCGIEFSKLEGCPVCGDN